MAFLDFLFGSKQKTKQFNTFTPEQQQTMNQLLSGSQQQLPYAFDYLSQLLSPGSEALQAFQAPAMRQFQEEIIPTIAERFTGMDAQKSSAFGQQLGQAGAGLAENLSAQRASLGSNAISQLQGLLSTGMRPSFENVVLPGTQGFLGGLAQGASQGIGQAGGMAALIKLLPLLGLV